MKIVFYIAMTIVILSCRAQAQTEEFTDHGMFSGSGLIVLPNATVIPSSEIRLQFSRINFLQYAGRSLNLLGVGCGLSSNLEGYLKISGEGACSTSNEVSYSFGGKLRLPILFPYVRHIGLWMESTNSDMDVQSSMFPVDAIRYGVVATFDSNGIHPTALLGMAKISDEWSFLIGGGVTYAKSHNAQYAIEFIHGYLDPKSWQFNVSGSVRAFSNVSFTLSPGYITSRISSSWIVSLGVSVSTADIDFHPAVHEEETKENFVLPSIEEIEKQSSDEKKND